MRALILACAACVVACAPSDDPETPPIAVNEAPPRSAGHERMVERLAAIAAELEAGSNAYLGTAQIAELEARIAALPPGPGKQRWLYELALGRHNLRLGRIDEGVRHHLAAYELLRAPETGVTSAEGLDTVLELAVAHLRKGETDNCAQRHTADSCILPIRGGGVHEVQDGSRGALPYLREVIDRAPAGSRWSVEALWLLNLAYMTLGEYPDAVPAGVRVPPEAFASQEPFPRFVNVAEPVGLNTFDLSGGVVVEDLDGDGWLDVMTSTWDPSGPLRLHRNDGAGGFDDRTRAAGLVGITGGLNLVHADYDNDGDADVLVLRGAWLGRDGAHPNSLLRNEGDGTFLDVTFEAVLAEVNYRGQTAGWADYDGDGDLDLYVGNEFTPGAMEAPCQLFRNEGDGTFVDVAPAAGVENFRFTKGVAWGDHDGDGDPDLYVSNLGHENRLYRNEGDGTFVDVAAELGVTRPIYSFPVWFWDFDNDGRLDLFVSGYGAPGGTTDLSDVVAGYVGLESRADRARLYHGVEGGFEEIGDAAGLSRTTLPMGSNYGDLDNDGYPDFYLGTGYPHYEGLMPNVMFRNRGGREFVDVTTAGGFGHLQKGHAVAFADLDNDGDQDVFEQMGGAFPGDAFANTLYENPGFDGAWLKLSLVGTESNRSAIGARVRVDVVERGATRSVHAHVSTGGSFGSGPLRREIGLGAAERIESLEVRWPTTGAVQVFRDVPLRRWLEIREGDDTLRERELRRAPFRR
jgi:hypothetical protein